MNNKIIYIVIFCLFFCSNIVFSADDSIFINKQQEELEQLKVEVERLKAKKAELENENKRLSNFLNSNLKSNDSKIKQQLEEKLAILTIDNKAKEITLNTKQEDLSKAKKEKVEIEIKKAEKKKDLELKKREVKKAEEVLNKINEENINLISNCDVKVKEMNKIEEKYGLEKTKFSSDDYKDVILQNKRNDSGSINNSNNNSNKIIIHDFTYSSGFNYCVFRFKTNNLNKSLRLCIYDDGGHIVNFFDSSVFSFKKDKNNYELDWDLKDSAGNTVEKGHYIARIEVNGKELESIIVELTY